MGAFEVISHLSAVRLDEGADPLLLICLPENASVGQMIRIFQKYVKDHPEHEHIPYPDIVLKSLWEQYFCLRR
jgi:hypothetical protein